MTSMAPQPKKERLVGKEAAGDTVQDSRNVPFMDILGSKEHIYWG